MSAQRLSEKSCRRIGDITGKTIAAGWAYGGYIHQFATVKHEHGWANTRTHEHGLYDPSEVEHFRECEALFPGGKLMAESTKLNPFVTNEKLAEWFGFHPANTDRKRTGHEIVRTLYWVLATEMNALLPEGPDKTIALRALDKAAMQANSVLARGGGPNEDRQDLSGGWPVEITFLAERLLGLADNPSSNPVVVP